MRASSRFWTWLGLALLVLGLLLLLLPQMPATALGGNRLVGAPAMPWDATVAAILGLIVLLWQRRQGGSRQ
ncbi:MAG: hypothetical protein ACRD1C_05270 [Terriglobales bacterium]